MLDEKDLQAISDIVDAKISASEKRMTAKMDASEKRMTAKMDASEKRINSRLDKLEEHAIITREAANALLEWAEDVSNAIRFPLPRVGDHKDA